jgi:hypothetical protein
MRLQVGGQKLVSEVEFKAPLLPRLDPVDEALLLEQCVRAPLLDNLWFLSHISLPSGKKVLAFASSEQSTVRTADDVPVDPWDPKVMVNNGRPMSTKPFHAFLCELNATRDPSLRKRLVSLALAP